MYVKPILWIHLFMSVQVSLQDYDSYEAETYDDSQPLNCSTTESIRGGHVTYSQGGLEGSVLTYHCGPGRYPFPVSFRLCGADGEWSPMRLTSGRPTSRATCKDVLCPAQLQLDNGDFWPRDQWSRVGTMQHFSCQEGFTLYGSAQRNCTLSGEWTGTTPICDNNADDCSDPGIPPGAQRSGGQFHTGEKVVYRCQAGLDLLGSAERICLENREWSGSTPRCQAPHTFDSPSVVAAALAGSLAGVMDVLSPEYKKKSSATSFGRTFRVSEGSRMNVYILLDTSGSIVEQDFNSSRNATIALIRKLDSYEVQLKFHVLSFASQAIDIVNIIDTDVSSNADNVIWDLENFDYKSHGKKTGTNLHAALLRVSDKINFFKQNSARNHFNETQNIIIIETDGYSNTGKNPKIALEQIRNLLGYHTKTSDHTDETMLDVYVFGIGDRPNKDQLNSLASHKRGEDHIFFLEDFKKLGNVFNSIISDKSVTMCGVAQEMSDKKAFTRPWHVTLESATAARQTSPCVGSIVSPKWILTAAHCFARASTEERQKRRIRHGEVDVVVKNVIMHPNYNTRALSRRNVSEFYDYDVALVEVNPIPLSREARPICLPCTVPASRAMKKVNSTCREHRMELLPLAETPAFFIRDSARSVTYIQTESKRHCEAMIDFGETNYKLFTQIREERTGERPSCVEKALQTLKEPTDVTLDEYVTDRFLCSGGAAGKLHTLTCKGDSGGSLFLQKRQRYFQVGIVSWGTTNTCDQGGTGVKPPPDARDFHIDVFKIMPWLKKYLGKEIEFLPDVK